MRVILRFDNPDDQSVSGGWKKESNAVFRYKVRVNKSKVQDYLFRESGEAILPDITFKPGKNVLSFRPASPDEEDELKHARRKNALRGFLFAVMAILLPCAHMSFENTNRPFTKIKFAYAEGHDFVLHLKGDRYRATVEPRQAPTTDSVYGESPIAGNAENADASPFSDGAATPDALPAEDGAQA